VNNRELYPRTELERVMKVQEVLMRAIAGKLSWYQAAEILGSSVRSMRRWKAQMEELGVDGLMDRRRRRPSQKKVPLAEIQRVVGLYGERFSHYNMRHFHQVATRDYGVKFSYTLLRRILQESGLVKKKKGRGRHRRRRERKACLGEMVHLDGSTHAWIRRRPQWRWTLIQMVDDATSRVLYARFEEGETALGVFRALSAVVEEYGIPLSLYTDRAGWAFETRVADGPVDKKNLTRVGEAMKRLGVEHIPSYSPQARGRSERVNRTLQDRLVNELDTAGIETMEEANRYLEEIYLEDHNARFSVAPRDPESAFVPAKGFDVRTLFYEEEDRTVRKDNTVTLDGVCLQISKQPGRVTCAGLVVQVRRFMDGSMVIMRGVQCLGTYGPNGDPVGAPRPMEAAGPDGKPPTDAVSHKALGRRKQPRRPQLPQAPPLGAFSALRASA
jgi:transposase